MSIDSTNIDQVRVIAHGFQSLLSPPKRSGWFKGEIAYHVDDIGRVDLIDDIKITPVDQSTPNEIQNFVLTQETLGEPFATILNNYLMDLYETE